jgi:hypothetical protein
VDVANRAELVPTGEPRCGPDDDESTKADTDKDKKMLLSSVRLAPGEIDLFDNSPLPSIKANICTLRLTTFRVRGFHMALSPCSISQLVLRRYWRSAIIGGLVIGYWGYLVFWTGAEVTSLGKASKSASGLQKCHSSPSRALHMDPDYYPEPDEFQPERCVSRVPFESNLTSVANHLP